MSVQDLWLLKDGTPSKRHGRGLRYRARAGGETRSFPTLRAANAWIKERAERPYAAGVTVDQLLERWKAGKAGLAQRSQEAARDAALVASVRWGSTPAHQILRQDVQEWVAGMTVEVRKKRPRDDRGRLVRGADGTVPPVEWVTRPASQSQRAKALQALSGALRIGVELGQIPTNVAADVSVPSTAGHDHHYLTTTALQRIAQSAGQYEPMIMLLGTAGTRIGETVALDVGDVVRSRGRIRVRRTTSKARRFREIPVMPPVLDMLDLDRDPHEPLFTSPTGGRVSVHNWRARVWQPIAPPGVRIHDLRHTAASLAIASGADVKMVQEMLGHKSAVMTLDLYGHLWNAGLDDVAARMAKMFQPVPVPSD